MGNRDLFNNTEKKRLNWFFSRIIIIDKINTSVAFCSTFYIWTTEIVLCKKEKKKNKTPKVSSLDGIPISNVNFIPLDIHTRHDDSIHERSLHQYHTDHMIVGIWSLYRTLGCRTRGPIHIHVCIHLMGYPTIKNIKYKISYYSRFNVQLDEYRNSENLQRILSNKSKSVLSWWRHILYWCHMGLDGMLPLQIKSLVNKVE